MILTAGDYQRAAALGMTADELRRKVFVRGASPSALFRAAEEQQEQSSAQNVLIGHKKDQI